MFLDPADFW